MPIPTRRPGLRAGIAAKLLGTCVVAAGLAMFAFYDVRPAPAASPGVVSFATR